VRWPHARSEPSHASKDHLPHDAWRTAARTVARRAHLHAMEGRSVRRDAAVPRAQPREESAVGRCDGAHARTGHVVRPTRPVRQLRGRQRHTVDDGHAQIRRQPAALPAPGDAAPPLAGVRAHSARWMGALSRGRCRRRSAGCVVSERASTETGRLAVRGARVRMEQLALLESARQRRAHHAGAHDRHVEHVAARVRGQQPPQLRRRAHRAACTRLQHPRRVSH
jgi:hypothetical protein